MGKMFSFAHLMGAPKKPKVNKAKKPKAEGDTPNPDDEQLEDETEGDELEPDDGDDPQPDDEAEDDSDDTEAEDDEEKKEAKARREGAKAERNRCASIFASEHASGRVGLAAQLAFGTSLSVRAAIEVLKTSPKEARGGSGLGAAMSSVVNPSIGDGGGNSPASLGTGTSLVANAKKRADAAKLKR